MAPPPVLATKSPNFSNSNFSPIFRKKNFYANVWVFFWLSTKKFCLKQFFFSEKISIFFSKKNFFFVDWLAGVRPPGRTLVVKKNRNFFFEKFSSNRFVWPKKIALTKKNFQKNFRKIFSKIFSTTRVPLVSKPADPKITQGGTLVKIFRKKKFRNFFFVVSLYLAKKMVLTKNFFFETNFFSKIFLTPRVPPTVADLAKKRDIIVLPKMAKNGLFWPKFRHVFKFFCQK